jgi:tetratricopeptide (TPR) repeat protein
MTELRNKMLDRKSSMNCRATKHTMIIKPRNLKSKETMFLLQYPILAFLLSITARTSVQSTELVLEYASLCDISVFLRLDDLDEALQELNQGLAINEKVYGKDHLATAACYNNIGAVMNAMGDNYEALEMLIQGLATFEKVYGKEHPATATAYTNIGSVMQAMGNNVGALEVYNQGLAIREKVLSKEHPDTAESYNNIALLMQTMGNTAGAQEMLKNRGLANNDKAHTSISY